MTAEDRFLRGVITGAFDLTPVPRPETIATGDVINHWYEERWATNPGAAATPQRRPVRIDPINFKESCRFPAVVYIHIGINHTIHPPVAASSACTCARSARKCRQWTGESYDAREAREQAARQPAPNPAG